mmetsp:Transcript_22077/g.48782  ORF Transcript_22077/g.48782 Transcript_22077/m.48782 type:complete len:340 (+) Transcript_22077:69-1088(+)|eukprot:CAMPEP_0170608728 /NCGR_PEP_ID=MMETSP0224-20130122/21740_1 /TAXON_ID=285029 /ORGANISM="Togula jolla, Strain CCCM 725" /LENGTH=339 /DNA_ID=CAMNT_0010933975 /DNA_START=53 /DNA_END=1072 /DNA_ORIENTATION=-
MASTMQSFVQATKAQASEKYPEKARFDSRAQELRMLLEEWSYLQAFQDGLAAEDGIQNSIPGGLASAAYTTSLQLEKEQQAPESMTRTGRKADKEGLAAIVASWPLPSPSMVLGGPSAAPKSRQSQSFDAANESAIAESAGSHSTLRWKEPGIKAVQPYYLENLENLEKVRDMAECMPVMDTSLSTFETTHVTRSTVEMQKPVRVNGIVLGSEPQAMKELPRSQHAGKQRKTLSEAANVLDTSVEKAITTLLLGNLPYRATKKDIVDAVDAMGFKGFYHVCHFPNAKTSKPRTTNLGYAFIRFANGEAAAAFVMRFSTFRLSAPASEKRCTLRLARLQY